MYSSIYKKKVKGKYRMILVTVGLIRPVRRHKACLAVLYVCMYLFLFWKRKRRERMWVSPDWRSCTCRGKKKRGNSKDARRERKKDIGGWEEEKRK